MKVKVTISLEESNWRELQHRALDLGTSASAIIDELVASYLKKPHWFEKMKKGGKR
jgi:hypothetical protein